MNKTGYNKLKTNLKLVIQRLKMLEKKKTENALKARREIASYIVANKIDRAKIRVEAIIREDYLVEALETIEMYCDLLLARFGLLEQMKNLDEGLAEAISSIIWAAPRITDIQELGVVVDLLTKKYGKQYALAAREGGVNTISEKLKKKMSIEELPKIMIERYMIEIAKSQNVPYVPDIEVMLKDEIYLAEEAIANKRPGFLIDLGPNHGPPPPPLVNPGDPYAGPSLGFQYGYAFPPGHPFPPGVPGLSGPPGPSGSQGLPGPPPESKIPSIPPSFGNEKGNVDKNVSQFTSPSDFGFSPKAPSDLFNSETNEPPTVPNYDPPNYHSMFPDTEPSKNTIDLPKPPPPAPRKSKMNNNETDNFDLPDLPNVPNSLPDLDCDVKKDDIDFDDLAARFDALKKKK